MVESMRVESERERGDGSSTVVETEREWNWRERERENEGKGRETEKKGVLWFLFLFQFNVTGKRRPPNKKDVPPNYILFNSVFLFMSKYDAIKEPFSCIGWLSSSRDSTIYE